VRISDRCPLCGSKELGTGYGLMGGGIGPYEFCLKESCEYFRKEQDRQDMAEPEEKAP
jgi:hypothetical protein